MAPDVWEKKLRKMNGGGAKYGTNFSKTSSPGFGIPQQHSI